MRTVTTSTQPLSAGRHDVRVEYAKSVGPGLIRVTLSPVNTPVIPPTAAISGPQRVIVGETFTLDGSASTPGSGEQITSYAWDLGDGTAAAGATIQHVYRAAGFYNVTLTVTNDRGVAGVTTMQTRADGAQATPPPVQPPVAVIVAPSQGVAGEPIVFDASQSTSSNPLLLYGWNFGDGTTAIAVQAFKTYSQPGIYNVVLNVRDDQGQSSTTSHLIQIFAPTATPTPNIPPTPTSLPPPTPDLPPTPTPTMTPIIPPTPIPPTPIPGQPTAPLEGTPPIDLAPDGTPTPDGEPATPPQAVIENVHAGAILPVVSEGGVQVLSDVTVNQVITLVGSQSVPGTYPITSWYWVLSDGGITSQDEAFQVTFQEPGVYSVSLTVSDEFGLSSSLLQEIRVVEDAETQ